MEISFEEPYDDVPIFQDNPKQKRILISLNSLDFVNRPPVNFSENQGSSSPITLIDENNPNTSNRSNQKKYQISSLSNSSSRSRQDPSLLHNQLKIPNFNIISKIYMDHSKAEDQLYYQIKPRPLPRTHSRPSSAPLCRRSIVQDLVKEREEEFKKTCTFKPKINSFIGKKSDNLTTQQRFQKLSRPKSESYEQRERLRREKEESELSNCTFKPNISYYKGLNSSFSEFPVNERLYQDAEAKFYEREKVQRMKEEELLSSFPFRPQIQGSCYKLLRKDRPPIYTRVQELQQEINDRKNQIVHLSELNDENLTFQPKINEKSYYLAFIRKKRNLSLGNRCHSLGRSCNQIRSFEENCTFSPNLTSFSHNTAADFLKRQKEYQAKSQARREAYVNQLEEENRNFTPDIGITSKYLAENSKHRKSGTLETRLMNEGVKNKEMKKEIKKKYYSGFNYEPEINEISRSIGRSSSLIELSSNKPMILFRQRMAEEKMVKEEKNNSFTPKLTQNKDFGYVTSHYTQSNELLDKIKEQFTRIQKKREEEKKIKDAQEMRECTFTPLGDLGCVNGLDSRSSVKGLDRFMELRSLAKRKNDELKTREKKIFFQSVKSRVDSYTVPQPFNIHPSMKKEKIARVREELARREKTECRFYPKINNSFQVSNKKSGYSTQNDYQYTSEFE